jgi:DNA polymerase alpha subunit B
VLALTAQIVDSTLVINPGFLSRARTAGTFSKLVIHPKERRALEAQAQAQELGEEGEGEGEVEHEVYARARAETWKI